MTIKVRFAISPAQTTTVAALILLALVAVASVAFVGFTPPFGKWSRVTGDPILSPKGDGFESAGTFNPAVIKKDGKFVMLYRAQDRIGTSSLGYASSDDGIHFTRRPEPVMIPETAYEKGGGVEDPRLQKLADTYYLTYTGYNNVDGPTADKKDAQLCLATSTDLIHWQRQGVIIPSFKGKWNVKWTKSGAIVPEKINGKYWMYYLADAKGKDTQMGVAYSDDSLHWTEALDHPVLASRPRSFDSQVVEPGPPPIMTSQGIFLIYNGADDKLVYSTGWVLFDKNDPTKVLARAAEPMFAPEKEWEKVGQVPNVVFVEGMVRDGNRWLFYYGAADKYIGVATAPVH
ncbi:MAG: glycoside hydrolase family 130 protein [Terriglobales bacterium]